MVKSVEGIYRNGKVELVEPLTGAVGSRVIVTWVSPAEAVDLRQRGIDEQQAADLRRRLSAFAEDWDRPEMAIYDDLPARCTQTPPRSLNARVSLSHETAEDRGNRTLPAPRRTTLS
jgi:hypothetical protein